MTQQLINIGTVANDDTGDSLRTGGDKINDNFTELYRLVSPTNSVIVDSSFTETTGKIYATIANALTYIATQTPTAASPWQIDLYGSNSEDFELPKFVVINGGNASASLSGNITTAVDVSADAFYSYISNCKVSNCTLDGATEALILVDCTINMPSPTFTNGIMVIQGGSIAGGAYSSANVILSFTRVSINSGTFTKSTQNLEFFKCSFTASGAITFNGGDFYECQFGTGLTWNEEYVYNFYFCRLPGFSWTTTAATNVDFRNCDFNGCSFDLTTAPAKFESRNCTGPVTVTGANKDVWVNYGGLRTNYISIPIEFPEDGGVAPAATALYTNTNKVVRYRDFSGTADNDVTFDFSTPGDFNTDFKVQFRIKGIITNATGPSAEGVVFAMAGYGATDNQDSNQSFGTTINLVSSGLTYSQNDYFVTDWSDDVTISNISLDTMNQIKMWRLATNGSDTYAQDIGVTEIQIKYVAR